MTRFALVWLTAVVTVNRVVPAVVCEAHTFLDKEDEKLFKARGAPVKNLGNEKGQFHLKGEQGKRKWKRRRKTKNAKKQNYNEKFKARKKIVKLSDFTYRTIGMARLCRKTLELSIGSEFLLLSPIKRPSCKRMIVKVDGEGTLSINCPVFKLNDGGCNKESLTIKRYGRACETDAPEISGAKSLILSYRANAPRMSRGFECLIRADATGGQGKICNGCGVADINPTRIVGGQEADENEYPWMLSMIINSSFGQFRCGASLITPSWALTAQHCIVRAQAEQITVAYGIHKYEDTFTNPITADEVILHPDYNTDTIDSDIALLHLETPVPLSEDVLPICLATSAPEVGVPAIVTGWGYLSYDTGVFPEALQEVEVNIISNEECKDKYKDTIWDITDSMICAAKKDKDACSGDSGGPMAIKSSDGTYEQVGIVSFGIDCADENFPGVYARVDYFNEWITNTVTKCE